MDIVKELVKKNITENELLAISNLRSLKANLKGINLDIDNVRDDMLATHLRKIIKLIN